MELVESAGGIVLRGKKVIIVYQSNTKTWSYPKGYVETGEAFLDAAKREIWEETGVRALTFVKELGIYERKTRRHPDIIKRIHLFLFKTTQVELESHDEINPVATWVGIDEVSKLLSYEEDRKFFLKIVNELK